MFLSSEIKPVVSQANLTNIINPIYWKKCLSNKYLLLMLIILSIAIAIRIFFFIGFGLGDDSIYSIIVNGIMNQGFQSFDLNYGANYRIGLYLPMLLFFSIFGINDLSLVLYPLLTSLGSVIVIYFIGKELFGKETGIIAAILMTFCPFDAVFASTMTIDIITSFFVALCFLFFLKGDTCTGKKYILYFILSAIFLFYSYLIKIPCYLVLVCLVIITLIKIKSFKRHLVFYGSTIVLLLLSFVADRFLSGYFLNCSYTQLTQCIQPSWYVGVLLEYPRWLFERMHGGSLPFGYYFYLTIPALIYISSTRLKQALPVLIWLLVLFLIMEFIPLKFELPYKPSPRYPRYLHALLIPSVLILSAGFYELLKFKKTVFVGAFITFLVSSIVEAHILHKTWKEPFTDVNEASKFLLTLPEKPIYSDYLLLNRFKFDAQYEKDYLIPWDLNGILSELDKLKWGLSYFILRDLNEIGTEEKGGFSELKNMRSGYVVAGGSRSVEIPGWSMFIFNLNNNKPPQNWKLIKEIPKKLTYYRNETLKIFEVTGK